MKAALEVQKATMLPVPANRREPLDRQALNRRLFDDIPPAGSPSAAAAAEPDGSDDASGDDDNTPYHHFPALNVEQQKADNSRKEKRKDFNRKKAVDDEKTRKGSKVIEVDFLSTEKNLHGRALFEHKKRGKLLLESFIPITIIVLIPNYIIITLKIVWL